MTIHLIETWLKSKPGSNEWLPACNATGHLYGSNYLDDVTCEDCLKVASPFDEFSALPQTEVEVML